MNASREARMGGQALLVKRHTTGSGLGLPHSTHTQRRGYPSAPAWGAARCAFTACRRRRRHPIQ